MHEAVHAFVQSVVEAFDLQGPVYEFGCSPSHSPAKVSSTLNCFIDIGYVGSDLHQGAEMDRLEELSSLPYPSHSARTICCLNVLERLFEPQRAMDEMLRLLTPGGIVLLCASLHAEQSGVMGQYWQMTPQGIERLLSPLEATLVGWQGPDSAPHSVFGIGCRGPIPSDFLPGTRRFLDALQRRTEAAAQQTRRRERMRRWLLGWTRNPAERQRDAQRYHTRFALRFPLGSKLDLRHVLLETPSLDSQAGSRIDFHG